MQELGNVGQGVKMLLELTLGHKKQHDEIDGLIIQGIKINPFDRTSEGSDDFVDQIGGGMGDTDAKADAGAHRTFPLLHYCRNLVAVFGFDFSCSDKIVDKFINGFPSIGSPEVGENLLFLEDISERHTVELVRLFRRNWMGNARILYGQRDYGN